MLTRPWPIRILAALFILAPIANAILLALAWDVPLAEYLRLLGEQPWWVVAEVLLPLPAAGFAIYAMKRWSYLAFFGITGFVFLRNAENIRLLPGIVDGPVLVGTYAVNLFVVAYFLIPAVRTAYFNSRLRWWEALPRYRVEIPMRVSRGDSERTLTTADLSAGGALLRSREDASVFFTADPNGDPIRVEFAYGSGDSNARFAFPAALVHRRQSGADHLYGLQFRIDSPADRRRMKRVIADIGASGALRLQAPPPLWSDFRSWLRTVGTKRAWIPTHPTRPIARDPASAPARSE